MFARTVVILFVALVVLAAGGILLSFIGHARAVSDIERGRNNLRQLAGFAIFHAAAPGDQVSANPQEYFPPATLPAAGIEVNDRMSWAAFVLPTLDSGKKSLEEGKKTPLYGVWSMLDPKLAWNKGDNEGVAKRQIAHLLSPASSNRETEGGFPKTSYLASTGIQGKDPSPKDRGLFDMNERTLFTAVTDGLSNTISFVETAVANGAWLHGGAETMFHPLAAELEKGKLEQVVGGLHPRGFLASFADGSVRFMTYRTDAGVFRSQLTIAGTETLE